MKKIIFIVIQLLPFYGFSQKIPFIINKIYLLETEYSTSMQLSDTKINSTQKKIIELRLKSINSDGSYSFIWNCTDLNNPFTDVGSKLDICIKETLLKFPIELIIDRNGTPVSWGDTITLKDSFLNKFRSVADKNKLDDQMDGRSGYESALESQYVTQTLLGNFPELDVFCKSIKLWSYKSQSLVNDKYIFNDIIFNYSDTIKIDRRTEIKIKQTPISEVIFTEELSKTDLRDYLISKYPEAWKRSGYSDADIEPFKQKLNDFQPIDRKSIKVTATENRTDLISIEYEEDEEILLMGGSNIKCFIKRL